MVEGTKINYVLVIDKTRDDILGAMFQSLAHPLGGILFRELCRKRGIKPEDVHEFMNETSIKMHELGWCEDPECDHKNEKKQLYG